MFMLLICSCMLGFPLTVKWLMNSSIVPFFFFSFFNLCNQLSRGFTLAPMLLLARGGLLLIEGPVECCLQVVSVYLFLTFLVFYCYLGP